MGEIPPVAKSPGSNSNALAYAECTMSTSGGLTCTPVTFFVSEPKFIETFWFDVGMMEVDKAVYRLLITVQVAEIFAVKVKSCLKLHQIFDIFCSSKF